MATTSTATSTSNNVTMFYLYSTLTFGKYKGKTVKEVMTLDPGYILWAYNNIEWFTIDKETYLDAHALCDTEGAVPDYKEKGAASKQDATPSSSPSKRARYSQADMFDSYDEDDGIPF